MSKESIGYEPGTQNDPRWSALRLIVVQAQAADKLLKLLRKPDKWAPIGKAVDAHGKEANPLSSNATHWSLLGALYKCRLAQSEVMALRIFFERGQKWTIESVSNTMPRHEQVKILKGLAKNRGMKEQRLKDYEKLVQTYRERQLTKQLEAFKAQQALKNQLVASP